MRTVFSLFVFLVFFGCELPSGAPSPTPTPNTISTPTPTAQPTAKPVFTPTASPSATSLNKITDVVSSSKCSQYAWKERGKAPVAYLQGVAITYARSVCQPSREDVKLVSSPRQLPEPLWDYVDALSWYNSNFNALGLNNDNSGVDTLRNAYTLLIGLGMRESSGIYCTGRDLSAKYTTGETAEAGLFQASWGANHTNPALLNLHKKYQAGGIKCFLDVFSKGVSCSVEESKNWGTGDGVLWQKMTKECPSYAVEYSAILLRTSGGTKGEFGPLRRKEVELNLSCLDMLKQVEAAIKAEPQLCTLL